jgi:hypothetical protein
MRPYELDLLKFLAELDDELKSDRRLESGSGRRGELRRRIHHYVVIVHYEPGAGFRGRFWPSTIKVKAHDQVQLKFVGFHRLNTLPPDQVSDDHDSLMQREGCGGQLRSRDAKRYCSRKCAFARTTELAHQRQQDRRKPCPVCGKLSAVKSRGRVLAKSYCSTECQRQALKIRAAARAERHPKSCPGCGVKFIAVQRSGQAWSKFCTAKCYGAHKRRNMFSDAPCSVCGKVCQRRTAQIRRSKRVVCSRACQDVISRGANHAMFRAESILDPKRRGQTGRWKRVSAEARTRDGHACRRCGRARRQDERQFPVDHVIPWRVFESKDEADALSNLATLCPQCHAWKTSTIESQYLRGDVLGMQQYRTAISL